MNEKVSRHFNNLINNYPKLRCVDGSIINIYKIIRDSYRQGGKLLICGNGGSAADADHIVGELMKGFLSKRPIAPLLKEKLQMEGIEECNVNCLQMGLPAINLAAHASLFTATINDLNSDLVFAQQVVGYGKPEDVLLGISTSGNSKNVVYAVKAAKALGLKTVGMTGVGGGKMAELCDETVKVPESETFKIQELHLPVYHALCAMIEEEFFGA